MWLPCVTQTAFDAHRPCCAIRIRDCSTVAMSCASWVVGAEDQGQPFYGARLAPAGSSSAERAEQQERCGGETALQGGTRQGM